MARSLVHDDKTLLHCCIGKNPGFLMILPQLWDLAEHHLQIPQFYINPRFSIVFPGLWHGSPTKELSGCPPLLLCRISGFVLLDQKGPGGVEIEITGILKYSNPQTDAELCFQHGTVFDDVCCYVPLHLQVCSVFSFLGYTILL